MGATLTRVNLAMPSTEAVQSLALSGKSKAVADVFASFGITVVSMKTDRDGNPQSAVVRFPLEKHVYLTTGTDLTERMKSVAGFEMQDSRLPGQYILPFHETYRFRQLNTKS